MTAGFVWVLQRDGWSAGADTGEGSALYLPPLQAAFGTAALGVDELALLAPFPFVVWGSDELRRWALRRRA